MLMGKQVILLLVSLVIVLAAYRLYVDQFWQNYLERSQPNGIEEEIEIYAFTSLSDAKSITNNNFLDYQWRRVMLEPYHFYWINEVTLTFNNDSLMSVKSARHLFEDNWWSYPIFQRFKEEEYLHVENFIFNKEKMYYIKEIEPTQLMDSLHTIPPDTVFISIVEDKLVIKDIF